MMERCLYCYKELAEGEKDFHKAVVVVLSIVGIMLPHQLIFQSAFREEFSEPVRHLRQRVAHPLGDVFRRSLHGSRRLSAHAQAETVLPALNEDGLGRRAPTVGSHNRMDPL